MVNHWKKLAKQEKISNTKLNHTALGSFKFYEKYLDETDTFSQNHCPKKLMVFCF